MKDPTSQSLDNIVRIGVINNVSASGHSGNQNHLLPLNKNELIENVVKELCTHWKFQDPNDYGLVFEASKEYVTERNKHLIKNGTTLKFCISPQKKINEILQPLKNPPNQQTWLMSLKSLHSLCSDFAIAQEFLKRDGLEMIVAMSTADSVSPQALCHLASIFHEILKHEDLLSWEDPRITDGFMEKIASILHKEFQRSVTQDEKNQQSVLALMESLVCIESKYQIAEKILQISGILQFLESDNVLTQQNALALFNTLFRLGTRQKKMKMKQEMEDRNTRRRLMDIISQKKANEEMKHQLYVLQTLLLNLLEEKMMTKVDSQDQKALEKIKELRKIAFDVRESNGIQKTNRNADDYKKLGFKNEKDPTLDFRETPPGSLALEMMYLFAVNHSEHYTKVVLENSCSIDNQECPFARSSIEVVKLICSIIGIGQEPKETGAFLPMFFSHENPLEEMFSITIEHVSKTWREMRAKMEDFQKVMDVTRDQISIAIKTSPISMDEYKKNLKSYSDINESRREEFKHRGEREGQAIQHLKSIITPEIIQLIQTQRLQYLVSGSKFNKYKREGGKERGKHVFCRLSNNHKTFHFGDCSEDQVNPSLEKLPSSLKVSEIKDFLFGPASALYRAENAKSGRTTKDSRSQENLTFTIFKENGDTLDFTVSDEKTFSYWCDGINVLLRKEMTSLHAQRELEMFLQMEVKIRLLDLEGIDIPDSPPPVPKLPKEVATFLQEV